MSVGYSKNPPWQIVQASSSHSKQLAKELQSEKNKRMEFLFKYDNGVN